MPRREYWHIWKPSIAESRLQQWSDAPPPDFLFMANKRPPKKNGVASFGQRPAKTTLVKPVRAPKKSVPDSRHSIISLRCWGRMPSGPPEEPVGKDSTAWRNSISATDRAESGLISDRSSSPPEAGGCFSCSFCNASPVGWGGLSSEQMILIAALIIIIIVIIIIIILSPPAQRRRQKN